MRLRLICFVLVVSVACTKSQQDTSTADTPRTSAPETVATPKPIESLALLSPAAGDTLVEGRTYIIRWTAGPVQHINLGAAMGGHDKGLILHNAPSSPDSLAWIVPIGFVTGFGPPSSNQVRLRLENADNAQQFVETGPFVVTGTVQR